MSNEVEKQLLPPQSRQESAAEASASFLNDDPTLAEINGQITNSKISPSAEQPICFVATPDELIVLVKHWVNRAIKDRYFLFWGQCFGSSDLRRIDLDWKRVNEIAKVLGDELTRTAVEEAYQQAAQHYDRNDWIVFLFGTQEEEEAYQNIGGQFLEEFPEGVADRLASQVAARVFREGPEKKQMSLLKTELKRHSTKFCRLKNDAGHIVEIFGIIFPSEIKSLILSTGIDDPEPNPRSNTFFKAITLEQGKAILAALDEAARKGEGALRELVAEPEDGECD